MMANDWQRLNIWLVLKNRFDFEEFSIACGNAGIRPQPVLEFAQKAGMVSTSMLIYPELPVAEAYLKFIAENQIAFTPPSAQMPAASVKANQQDNQPQSGIRTEKATITFADGTTRETEVAISDGTQQSCCGGGTVR
jgi:hypothetical protein